MKEEENNVVQKEFLNNMEEKIENTDFRGDMNGF